MAKPKIRFKGYGDDWEQRKLGDVAKYRNGKAHESDIDDNGKYIVVNSQIEPLMKNEIAFVLSDVPNGRAIARTFLVDKSNKYTLNQRIAGITPLDETYPYFLHILMNRNRYFLSFDDGAKQTNLSVSDVMNFEEMYPSYDEQKRIGKFFNNLDNLITLHQRKCDETKKLKKYMLQKMFPQNGSKKPEIRLEGFTDDWEQRKFRDTFDFMQNNALSRADLSSAGGDVMNVHYGDVLVKYGEVLDVKKDEMTYLLDASFATKYLASLLQNGDIIIADAAEDETVGKCSEIAGLTDEKVLSGLHTIPCRPRENFAEGYLGYYMNSGSYHDQLLPLIQGTKVSSISKSAIQDTDIMYPKSETEQRQIGDYFRNLDHLITLHQNKCEELKKLKKFMLQNMFV